MFFLFLEPTSVPDDSEVRTIYDALQRGLRVSNNGPFLGERDLEGKYQWLNYKTVSFQISQTLITSF